MKKNIIKFNGKEDQAAIGRYVKSIDTVNNPDGVSALAKNLKEVNVKKNDHSRRIYGD